MNTINNPSMLFYGLTFLVVGLSLGVYLAIRIVDWRDDMKRRAKKNFDGGDAL